MQKYDVKCPICGKENKGLYLEETEGWMECERCGNAVQIMKYARIHMVPMLNEQQLALMFAATKKAVAG